MIVTVFNLAKDKKLEKEKLQNLHKSYLKCTQVLSPFISQHVKVSARLEREMNYGAHHELQEATL